MKKKVKEQATSNQQPVDLKPQTSNLKHYAKIDG
jgi:hypothetical protein